MLVSRWCYQSGPLKVIDQLSLNAIDCKSRVNFANGYCSVSIYSVDKSFVRHRYYSSYYTATPNVFLPPSVFLNINML